MTLVIENVKEEFLPAYKGLAKSTQAKLKARRSDKEIADEWKREGEEMMKEYKAGRLKAYTNAKAMHEDILNGK